MLQPGERLGFVRAAVRHRDVVAGAQQMRNAGPADRTRHPVLMDTTRLHDVLGVEAPDPRAATEAQIDWLWEHRQAVVDFRAS